MALSRLLRPMHTGPSTMASIAEIDPQSASALAAHPVDSSANLDVAIDSEISRYKLRDDFHKQACDASGHLYRKFYHPKPEHQ